MPSSTRALRDGRAGDPGTHLILTGDTNRPLEERRAIFIAGDDSKAKEIVTRLIEEIGFAAVDSGFLHEGGRSQQPGQPFTTKT